MPFAYPPTSLSDNAAILDDFITESSRAITPPPYPTPTRLQQLWMSHIYPSEILTTLPTTPLPSSSSSSPDYFSAINPSASRDPVIFRRSNTNNPTESQGIPILGGNIAKSRPGPYPTAWVWDSGCPWSKQLTECGKLDRDDAVVFAFTVECAMKLFILADLNYQLLRRNLVRPISLGLSSKGQGNWA